MKPFHVACVVSALAATASGASINLSPPSPVKLSHGSQVPADDQNSNQQRRSLRGPLPRILRRTQALKQKLGTEKRSSVRSQFESQLSYAQRTTPEYAEDMDYFEPHSSERPFDTSTSNIPRRVVQSGIPGFVEIAIPDAKAGVARTVSGLAYTTSPEDEEALELGTSSTHSTQFFLSSLKHLDGSSLFRLKAPITDSTTFNTVEHCATYATSPSGPLSMKKCGNHPGFSQRFSYDPASGEIHPAHTTTNSNDENTPITTRTKTNEGVASSSHPSSSPTKRSTSTSNNTPSSSAVLYFIPSTSHSKKE